MDVSPTASEPADVDPKRLLEKDIERARAERDDLARAMEADKDRLRSIRTALDSVVSSIWSDIFRQQVAMRDRYHWNAAWRLSWFGAYQFPLIGAVLLMGVATTLALGLWGALLPIGAYATLVLVAYVLARSASVAQVKKQRQYVGDDGKDIRFVAFTKIEGGLRHPYVGKDGPKHDATMEDRSWKIPGMRDQEALSETLFEVMDDRRNAIVLSRFPDKKPTLVHADLENPFIRPYGVFLQRAIERHAPVVQKEGEEFHQIVLRSSTRQDLEERLALLESELREFDGTEAIMNHMPVVPSVRNLLTRFVVLFRLADPATRRGLLLHAGGNLDYGEVVQSMALASAATILPLPFSQMKIGYVGQGAARVGRVFEEARRQRSIIYIPECETLFGTKGYEAYDAMRREIVGAINAEWSAIADEPNVLIVAATAQYDQCDPYQMPNFGRVIDLTPQIKEPTERVNVVVEPAQAGSGEDLWESVALPASTVERARALAAMMAHADAIAAQGLDVPQGLIVYGSDGDDVMDVAHSIAQHSGLAVVTTDSTNVNEALEQAREFQPAIVLLKYAEDLPHDAASALAQVLDDFRQSGIRIYLLATANNIDDVELDLRVRLRDTVEVATPDAEVRETMLRQLLAGRKHDFDLEQAIGALVGATAGLSRRAVKVALADAFNRAAAKLTQEALVDLPMPAEIAAQATAAT